MAEPVRGKGIMGIISRMADLDESGINKKSNGEAAKPAAGIFSSQASAPRSPMDRLQNIMPELYKVEKDPGAIYTLPADKLKTLCDLKLVDFMLNERGKKTAESFRMLESMAKEIKTSEPKPLRNVDDTPILGDKDEEKHTLAEKISAIPDSSGIRNDNVIIARGGGEIKRPKSVYLVETPRQQQSPAQAEKLKEEPKQETKTERKPLIPPS